MLFKNFVESKKKSRSMHTACRFIGTFIVNLIHSSLCPEQKKVLFNEVAMAT